MALAIIAWATVYVSNYFDEVRDTLSISFEKIIILLLLVLIEIIINGYIVNIVLHSFGIKLVFHEWFGLSSVTSMANLLIPFAGGVGIRAAYLKSKFNFPITSFLSTVAATHIIHLLVRSLIGMASLALLFFYCHIFNVPIFILFAAVSISLLSIMFLSAKLPKFKQKHLAKMNTVLDGLQIINRNYMLLLKLTGLFFLFGFVAILIMHFSFRALSINITVLQSSIISSLNSFSTLLTITPGAIGLSEAIIVFSSQLFGVILVQGVLAAALRRSIILLVVFTLGPIYSFLLIGHKIYPQKGGER